VQVAAPSGINKREITSRKRAISQTREIIGGILFLLGFAIWIFHFWVFFKYDDTRPRQPDPSAGRIYAQNNHGHYVYLTRSEASNVTWLRISTFGLAGSAFLIFYVFGDGIEWQKDQKRYREGKP
jgi:hypothetical protein